MKNRKLRNYIDQLKLPVDGTQWKQRLRFREDTQSLTAVTESVNNDITSVRNYQRRYNQTMGLFWKCLLTEIKPEKIDYVNCRLKQFQQKAIQENKWMLASWFQLKQRETVKYQKQIEQENSRTSANRSPSKHAEGKGQVKQVKKKEGEKVSATKISQYKGKIVQFFSKLKIPWLQTQDQRSNNNKQACKYENQSLLQSINSSNSEDQEARLME